MRKSGLGLALLFSLIAPIKAVYAEAIMISGKLQADLPAVSFDPGPGDFVAYVNSNTITASGAGTACNVTVDDRATSSVDNLVCFFEWLPETQAAINQMIVKGKFESPLITIDPDSFSQYQVTQVPTIISREQARFAKMVGSFNVEFFQRELAKKPDQDIFPVAGTTYPVEEKSIIKELEERAQKYDWEGAKKRAVSDTWKNQWMVDLPPAQEHKEFLIDPTVRVTQDVKDKQGRVIASAGELINPLSRFPQNLTMIIFDPLNPGQLVWAEQQYRQRLGSGKVMPMFTRIQKDNGWDHLNDLREKFNGKVFKVNEQIISRFQIKNTPALITTDQDKFRITLFSEAEVRGIGAPNLSEEK